MALSYLYITNARSEHLKRYSGADRFKLVKLERKYSKFNYIPLDVPRVTLQDPQRFIRWYTENSELVRKIGVDAAGSATNTYNFKAIDSPNQYNRIWTQNRRSDIFTEFPEIKAGIDALPVIEPQFSLWNAVNRVLPHRDQGVWEDLPFSFRIMLYDTNPVSTMSLQDAPGATSWKSWDSKDHELFKLPRLDETNTFAWNNLRTVHSSTVDRTYEKVLLILTNLKVDLDRYEDLMERSVQKYSEHAMISKYDRSAFCAF